MKKFADSQKSAIFAPRLETTKRDGLMGEWLSQWSAKPFTAVRIRFRPQKAINFKLVAFLYLYVSAEIFNKKDLCKIPVER